MVDTAGGAEALLHAFMELLRNIVEIVRLMRALAGA